MWDFLTMGKTKHISFRNSLKLDVPSLNLIMESLKLTMMSAVFQNFSVRRLHVAVHSYNYTSVDACQPGTSIPSLLKCRTATDSSYYLIVFNHRIRLRGV
ncbi:disease resistance protein [Trifolium medium]|uniref:Disease resistance protein n=1 Tax=Trifolium medium TaxID=97028 RepID=A0A392QRV3_9FABA|nr:disease resistance protein [Trifolium medium]